LCSDDRAGQYSVTANDDLAAGAKTFDDYDQFVAAGYNMDDRYADDFRSVMMTIK